MSSLLFLYFSFSKFDENFEYGGQSEKYATSPQNRWQKEFRKFQEKDGSSADWVTGGGNAGELYIEADPISTMQAKGGILYELGNSLSFFNFK